jgi:hypothetical protein
MWQLYNVLQDLRAIWKERVKRIRNCDVICQSVYFKTETADRIFELKASREMYEQRGNSGVNTAAWKLKFTYVTTSVFMRPSVYKYHLKLHLTAANTLLKLF